MQNRGGKRRGTGEEAACPGDQSMHTTYYLADQKTKEGEEERGRF